MRPTRWAAFLPLVVAVAVAMQTPLSGTGERRDVSPPVLAMSADLRRAARLDLLLQCLGPPDDLGDLLRNLRLPRPVVLPGQVLDHLVGTLGGGLHGDAAGDLFADRGVEEALEQPHF